MKRISLAVLLIFVAGSFASPVLAKTTFISVGTGGTGGIYYPYGGGVAEIWSKYVPNVKAVAEVTGASVENVKLAHKGETVVGLVMGDVAVAGFHRRRASSKQAEHPLHGHHVSQPAPDCDPQKAAASPTSTQMKGRNISTGSPGSGTNFMAEPPSRPWKSRTVTKTAASPSPKAPMPCATAPSMWASGPWDPPTSSIMDLATTHDIHIISLTPEQTAKVLAANETYSSVDLAGGTYNGVDEAVSTIGVWNVMVCQARFPKTWSTSCPRPFSKTTTTFQDPSIGRLHDTRKRGQVFAHPAASGNDQVPEGKGHRRAGQADALTRMPLPGRVEGGSWLTGIGLAVLLILGLALPGGLELRVVIPGNGGAPLLVLPLRSRRALYPSLLSLGGKRPIWEEHRLDASGRTSSSKRSAT
jgi:TRAP-type uncharacterized transport system substrate-binding protein